MHLKRHYFYSVFLLFYLFVQLMLLYFLKKTDEPFSLDSVEILDLYKNLTESFSNNLNFDNSRMYKVFYSSSVTKSSLGEDVTLVSQCSANHFLKIKDLCKLWKGPLSISVFSELENIDETLWNFAKLLHCEHTKDIKLQLVIPALDSNIISFNYENHKVINTEDSEFCQSYHSSIDLKNYNRTLPYPINLMRNIAKSASQTKYILIIDIDMIPSDNLVLNFLTYVKNYDLNNEKAIYVVPVFEIHSNAVAPRTKKELIEQVQLKNARPFYFVPCRSCQKYTRYNDWLMSNTSAGTRVLYKVKWKHPWEPFFIASKNVPNFDERFKQYGMNRVSQVCELHVAGYKFYVLDEVFLVHRGFKSINDFHESKNIDMESNRRLYSQFKEELKFRYPNSQRSC